MEGHLSQASIAELPSALRTIDPDIFEVRKEDQVVFCRILQDMELNVGDDLLDLQSNDTLHLAYSLVADLIEGGKAELL